MGDHKRQLDPSGLQAFIAVNYRPRIKKACKAVPDNRREEPRVMNSLDESRPIRKIRAIRLDDSFGEKLNRWLGIKNMTTTEFYRNSLLTSAWLSNVVINNVTPTKEKALAACIGLKLTLEESLDMLRSSGHTFSGSNLRDVIVRAYIEYGIYDIYEINEALEEYKQPLLGSKLK